MSGATVHLGDCLDLLRSLPAASVDAIVTDPPYGIGFMARAWDASVPGLEWAQECLRVLRPGGHLVAFGGTRTVHRLAVAIEDAGFEVRDSIGWVYYSGFPKSCDVSKQIDAAAGAEREVVGFATHLHSRGAAEYPPSHPRGATTATGYVSHPPITAPATDLARQWSGWGTALKPAQEPAILARKPLAGTVAATVLQHGTGAINIDGCRFAPGDAAWVGPDDGGPREDGTGRWPANLYHTPKACRAERERGCAELPWRPSSAIEHHGEGAAALNSPRAGAGRTSAEVRNHHPTVKPVRLMRWLCRLVTPPGGVVLDPFAGSGSTGVAAMLEGLRFTGSERESDYHRIAVARIAHAQRYPEAWADTAPGRQDEAVEEVEVLERVGQVRMFG